MAEADSLREQADQAQERGQEEANHLREAADAQEKADKAKKAATDADGRGDNDSGLFV